MTYQAVGVGARDGDHTGDKTRDAFTKINANFVELYGGLGALSGYVSATVTAASTNDFNPGSSFPTGYGRVDINPTTNDVTLTGLLAGTDSQEVFIRNVGSTYSVTFTNASSSSAAANRFTASGDFVLGPGQRTLAVYYSSPSPRWSIG